MTMRDYWDMPVADRRRAALEDLAPAGGRNAPVEIAGYDPAWPLAYAAESGRLAPLLPAGVQLHHFGSTAVPGLAAKPVIDMIALTYVDEDSSIQARTSEALRSGGNTG